MRVVNLLTKKLKKINFLDLDFYMTKTSCIFIILGIIILSILLNIIIKIRHHHPDLITNGLITLAVIGSLLIVNSYISSIKMMTTQSMDYSNENTQQLNF